MTDWQPIETVPRDSTVLVVVEPTENNRTFFGRIGKKVHPAYINDQGKICCPGTWKPDSGFSGFQWRSTHWMPLPAPPSTLTDLERDGADNGMR